MWLESLGTETWAATVLFPARIAFMGDRTRAAGAEVTVGARPELGRWRCAKYGTTEGCFADRFSIDAAVRDPSLRRMTLNLSIPSSVFS
jgi:hypothetical protein